MHRLTRNWLSDEEYVRTQRDEIDPTIKSRFRDAPGSIMTSCFEVLRSRGLFFMDDTVADFGGNDGTAAYQFYLIHKVKPLVVDCVQERTDFARRAYNLPIYDTFIERMPELKDKSIDWGFCSHTLEHLRDTQAGLSELKRVIKRGCIFVVPTSDEKHNHAHVTNCTTVTGWRTLIEDNGWTTEVMLNMQGKQVIFLATPCA